MQAVLTQFCTEDAQTRAPDSLAHGVHDPCSKAHVPTPIIGADSRGVHVGIETERLLQLLQPDEVQQGKSI